MTRQVLDAVHRIIVGGSGATASAVADLPGHSSISITGDIYGHTSDDTARKAVEGWSGALGL